MSGTVYDDPNREAVGLAPIWTGADGGEVTPAESKGKDDSDKAPAKKSAAKKDD